MNEEKKTTWRCVTSNYIAVEIYIKYIFVNNERQDECETERKKRKIIKKRKIGIAIATTYCNTVKKNVTFCCTHFRPSSCNAKTLRTRIRCHTILGSDDMCVRKNSKKETFSVSLHFKFILFDICKKFELLRRPILIGDRRKESEKNRLQCKIWLHIRITMRQFVRTCEKTNNETNRRC